MGATGSCLHNAIANSDGAARLLLPDPLQPIPVPMLEQFFLALDLDSSYLVITETIMILENHFKFKANCFEFLIEEWIGTNPKT